LAAWRRFFEALAEWRPLVLVFEDLHWADDSLLDFVDGLVEWVLNVPLLVVATARPELLERRPHWGGGKANATTLSLSVLSEEETGQLVSALLERSEVSADIRAALSRHAGGNALYAEQYVRRLGERRSTDELPMPETVQGIIAARIDALSAHEKTLLQNGAVFGKVFWNGAVLALNGIDSATASESLHGLERKEFIQRARRSSVAGESEYAFRHILFRDVAYSQIPRSVRAEKHHRAAAWIEALGRSEDHAEMLAHHHLRALELARDTGESTTGLVAQARASLVQAGDRAFSVNAFEAAATYYAQALDLHPETDQNRTRVLWGYARALFAAGTDERVEVIEQARVALQELGDAESAAEADAMLATVWWHRGHRKEVDEHLARALAVMHERPPSAAKARVLSAAARFRMLAYDENQQAIADAREALSLSEGLGLRELQADTLVTLGTARWNDGDADGDADIEEGLRVAVEHNALSAAQRACNNLASIAGNKGEFSRRRELLLQSQRLATRLGARDDARFITAQLIIEKIDQGAWDDALQLAAGFIAECERGSPHRQETSVRLLRAWIYCARDDVAAAWAECEKALSLGRALADPKWLAGVLADVAGIYAETDRLDEAKAFADEALSYDLVLSEADFVPLAWVAERLELDSRRVEAHLEHASAHIIWTRVAELILAGEFEKVADMSASMGLKHFETRARVRAARALLKEQCPADAEAQLQQALSWFRSVGASRYIREAEQLRAAGSHEQQQAARPHA
jgi:tetratricopeptide (TPR) repeat protein